MQALNVAGDRSNVFVAEFACDGAHRHGIAVVGATAFFLAEVGQLFGDVLKKKKKGKLFGSFLINKKIYL